MELTCPKVTKRWQKGVRRSRAFTEREMDKIYRGQNGEDKEKYDESHNLHVQHLHRCCWVKTAKLLFLLFGSFIIVKGQIVLAP